MSVTLESDPEGQDVGLRRLWCLRWWFAGVIVGLPLVAGVGLGYHLPWGLIAGMAGVVVLSNGLVNRYRQGSARRPAGVVLALLGLDLGVLTVLLYATGGAHNPFTTLYLVPVTVAILLLPRAWGWAMVGAATLAFALLFTSGSSLSREGGPTCCTDMGAHLQGMVLALLMAGSGIAFFVSSVGRDWRQRKEAIRSLSIEIREGQERASVGTLAASIAHELATPLGTIAVVSRDFERQACEVCRDGQCKADARLIREEVERCSRVLHLLGERAGGQEPEGRVLLGPEVLRQQLPLFLSSRVVARIDWVSEGTPFAVRLPAQGFFSALAVLVKNAAEASPPGSRIGIGWQTGAEGVSFWVRDRGPGLEADQVARLGQPFFTTKPPGEGMGLGLFLARTFCTEQGGRLEFESRPGEGTVARMSFPAAVTNP